MKKGNSFIYKCCHLLPVGRTFLGNPLSPGGMLGTVAFAYCIGLRPPWIKAYVLRELTYTHGYRAGQTDNPKYVWPGLS